MQYLKHRLRDLNQIWHHVAKGLYLCSGWVLTSWPNPRWRPSRHFGFSITCNISNTAWVIWSKFGRTSHWVSTYVLLEFWPLDLIQDGGTAAILDLALHAISQIPLKWFKTSLAGRHNGSLRMFFGILTSWINPRWRHSRHIIFSITCNISSTA